MRAGAYGEKKAAEYLRSIGYTILSENFRCKAGEIDLIAKKRDVLHYVEVKTRSNEAYGRPCEAVTPNKVKRIVECAKYYIWMYDLYDYEEQIDIIEILDGKINFMENVVFL